MSDAAVVRVMDRLAGAADPGDDGRLLARFRADRDETAFAALVRRHGPFVYGACRRILGHHADADDAFQAVFFVLARRAGSLAADRGLGPWLHGVAVRVSLKARTQAARRRVREMAAAKADRVSAPEPDPGFWAVIDEELARLPRPLREVVVLCDLGGRSHAEAAGVLGLAKGTVTKRLAKAHGDLAMRLRRRGLSLGAGGLAAGLTGRATAVVPARLQAATARAAVAFAAGRGGGSSAATALAHGVVRSAHPVVSTARVVALLGLLLAGGGWMLGGGPDDPAGKPGGRPRAPGTPADPVAAGTMWKECFTAEYETSLPVAVAFAGDGQTLLTGDTGGEVMAVRFPSDPPTYRWKANVGGSHAAVAYSADRRHVYATTAHGVRVLDATTGKEVGRIDEPGSGPIALGVFPDKVIAPDFTQVRVVFGDPRGYFLKSWAAGKLADTVGTIQTSTGPKGSVPADPAACPLAVDPKGRCAIMTGPVDATGEVAGAKGKNVLWAYACGDYEKGSPGNRVMVGHAATVVAAAWAREAATAATGDAAGRVIVWDATTMKEARRVELGGRVLAVALSDDGRYTAACVRGKQGGEFYVWETANPPAAMTPIHTQPGDFGGEPYGALAFAPGGKHLAGCATDRKWLDRPGGTRRTGQVHVWELAAEPKAQRPPAPAYAKPLPKGGSGGFAVRDNFTVLTAGDKAGAIDYRNVRDGEIQMRIVLGKFAVGAIRLSTDRRWLALEERPAGGPVADPGTFDVGVLDLKTHALRTVPACQGMLDVASGGRVVAVVRDEAVEVWDVAAEKRVKAAPFAPTRVDAARFSPDGKVLAVADGTDLVLWAWEDGKFERVDLGDRVGALEFTPDGKFLAEGPTAGDAVRVREAGSRKVVGTLASGAKRPISVPRLAYTQGGRVLIGCDNAPLGKDADKLPRITLWDAATAAVAHEIALAGRRPLAIDVSPNGRYLAAVVDEGEAGLVLRGWRLDGAGPADPAGPTPPAATRPR